MSGRTVVYVISAVLLMAAAALGGYLIGESKASTEGEAKQAQRQARLVAKTSAMKTAYVKGRARGRRAGVKAGRVRARRVGAERGGSAGKAAADDRLAEIEAEQQAEEAAQLTYDPQLPNGDPGYILPPDQRSVACIGISAETGECVGD